MNHIFASIIAYCKLEFLKVKTCLNHFALKYKLLLKANQIAFLELKKLYESVYLLRKMSKLRYFPYAVSIFSSSFLAMQSTATVSYITFKTIFPLS